MKRLFGSLGFQLFVWIFGLMLAVFGAFTYVTVGRTSQAWVASVEQQVTETCAIIERALRYGMLLNRKEDVFNTLRNIAQEPGVSAIRIYDKQGTIVFSTKASEINTRVNRTAEACVACHDPTAPLGFVHQSTRTRRFRAPDGTLMLGRIHPIENSPQCSNAPCHAHPASQTILGVLDLKMSLAAVDQGRRRARQTLLYMTLLMALVGGVVVAVLIWRFVRRPVRQLVEATRRVAAGDLDFDVEIPKSGELSTLGRAFREMTGELAQAREQKQRWEEQLESAVQRKSEELSHAQRQMAHMEKMASLGKLAATVAHELNNPLAGILVYAKLVARDLKNDRNDPESRSEQQHYLEVIERESARCGDIVKNLLTFSRQSPAQWAEIHVNQVVERSLMAVDHLTRLGSIRTEFSAIEGDDRMQGDANQMQQAMLAILVNAVEAMPSGGELTVTARATEEDIRIDIRDTGMGIPADVKPHIFEPFVSTKGAEKGVGLGLAVVYGIIRHHNGTVDVESEPGNGARFRLLLPRKQPDDARPDA